jgi:hypothetical protein
MAVAVCDTPGAGRAAVQGLTRRRTPGSLRLRGQEERAAPPPTPCCRVERFAGGIPEK